MTPDESSPRGTAALMPIARLDGFDTASREADAYWHKRSIDERLEHMETLRRLNHGPEAARPLQRILEIAQRPRG